MENSNKSAENQQDVIVGKPKKSVLQRLKNAFLNRYTALIIGSATIVSCGTEPVEEPQNQAPTVTLTDVVSNDTTNTVSGKLTATDSDGTITQKTLQAEATDGTLQTITLNADGTFSHTLTGSGKVFDTLLAKAKDNDNASDQMYKSLTPTVEVEMPNVDSTVANPNNTVDENSTDDINLVIEDANGLASTVFKNESTNELATYFNLIDNTKLQVKSGALLNHEVDSQIQGVITITDDLGNQVDKTITIDLNDLQEQQTIDIYGNGGLLPNGEAYAVKADEEETGQTLPIDYYVSGTGNSVVRQSEADIDADIANNGTYGSIQDDINGMHFDSTVPGYPDGNPVNPNTAQAMISFDDATNQEVVHASDGSELARYPRNDYGKQAQQILDKISGADSDNFRITSTTEYDVLRDKIVADTKNPTQPNVNTDYAIKTKLTE